MNRYKNRLHALAKAHGPRNIKRFRAGKAFCEGFERSILDRQTLTADTAPRPSAGRQYVNIPIELDESLSPDGLVADLHEPTRAAIDALVDHVAGEIEKDGVRITVPRGSCDGPIQPLTVDGATLAEIVPKRVSDVVNLQCDEPMDPEIAKRFARLASDGPAQVEPLTPSQLEGVNPGVRKLVTFLRANGFETCDSGDGKTHDFECDRPFAYVVIKVDPKEMVAVADLLRDLMWSVGVEIGPQSPEDSPYIQATYDPADGGAFLDMGNVLDEQLRTPGQRPPAPWATSDTMRTLATLDAEHLADSGESAIYWPAVKTTD